MGSTSKTCLLIITIQLISTITAQETDKRVPQGFVGMRGKKYYEADELGPLESAISTETDRYRKRFEEDIDFFPKRAPMGFMGMRGKKSDEYLTDEYVPKRDGSLIGQIEYTQRNDVSREPQFPILDELLNAYIRKLSESGQEDSNEVAKRAANVNQFYGVRGKKSGDTKRPFDLSFRGKFIGVRGKKDVKDSGAKEIKFLLNGSEPWPKRKGQMGFFGMRGKKWNYESSSEFEPTNGTV